MLFVLFLFTVWKQNVKVKLWGGQHTHHVFDSRQYLREDQFTLQIRQASSGGDPGEQLSSRRVLHHQMKPAKRLHHLIQTHDVGVGQSLHAAYLRREQPLRALVQTQLIQDLNSYPFWERRVKEKKESKCTANITWVSYSKADCLKLFCMCQIPVCGQAYFIHSWFYDYKNVIWSKPMLL